MSATPSEGRPERGARLAGPVVALACAACVVAGWVLRAAVLLRYPWDWSPDEGLSLDYARRVLEAPHLLYPAHGVVPYPCVYTPLYYVLLAPLTGGSFLGPRLLSMAIGLGSAAAAGWLAGGRERPLAGVAAAALSLAVFELTFWPMLVRPDGFMTLLWLAAAIPLLPSRLERGADALGAGRLAAGAALLLAAVLAKPTAILHGAPLVLAWWLVDARSAWRLSATMAAGGVAALTALQVASEGGFLAAMRLLTRHGTVDGQARAIVIFFVLHAWPLVLAATAGLIAATRAGARPWRDRAVVLLAGGVIVVPALSKAGAMYNYLLPALAALAVVAARWWAASNVSIAPAGLAAVALATAATARFPVPDAVDERTAAAFYAFASEVQRAAPGPVLGGRPDLVSFRSGQPVEIEASTFWGLVAHGVTGLEVVAERLQQGRYTLVVTGTFFPPPEAPLYGNALRSAYEPLGACELRFFDGRSVFFLWRPRGRAREVPFAPPRDTRCALVADAPVPAGGP